MKTKREEFGKIFFNMLLYYRENNEVTAAYMILQRIAYNNPEFIYSKLDVFGILVKTKTQQTSIPSTSKIFKFY